MAAPKDLRFTKSHEWVRLDGDTATFGITDHAQEELGDITYLELPDVGGRVAASEPLGVIESVKAASDIFAPIDGEVVERNEDVVAAPETVNSSPYGDAWLLKIKLSDPAQVAALMDSDAYEEYLAAEVTH
ncbi:MAG: glycine cleavage system protein GcvH [Thermomicrobiales bacterium]